MIIIVITTIIEESDERHHLAVMCGEKELIVRDMIVLDPKGIELCREERTYIRELSIFVERGMDA